MTDKITDHAFVPREDGKDVCWKWIHKKKDTVFKLPCRQPKEVHVE